MIRFSYHITFVFTIAGALIFTEQLSYQLLISLLILYISFNVLLYGGLYTINDITDLKSDAKHSLKRKRPLPSKKISVKSALTFSSILITLGLLSGFLYFGQIIFYFYLVFIGLNLLYSLFMRNIPYLDLIINALPHPLRFLMGVYVANSKVPYLFTLALFFLTLGLISLRRAVERDTQGWQETRSTLKFYSNKMMLFIKSVAFLLILFLAVFDDSVPKLLYVFIVSLYAILVFGSYTSKRIRNVTRSLLPVSYTHLTLPTTPYV